ncbi:exodeoxyribonuclease VII large subunit [archaeon]|nr:exodeoxyribonuclease VII large subunit [archaeon]
MDDSGLLKVSFGVAVFGLVLLFLVSHYSTVPVVAISGLSYDDVGTKVAVSGEVMSVRLHDDGHIFLEVSDGTGEISVAIFKNVAEKLDTQTTECITGIGSRVEVAGAVEEYKENLEIISQSTGDVKC